MGSLISSLLGAPNTTADGPGDSSSEPGHVQSFHSPARWQLHFNSLKETSQLLVIDFAASWCGPCKMMEPAVHAMASKFTEVSFAKIDVDELSEIAQEFGVQAMPTFVLVKKGQVIDRVVGTKKEELEKKIEKHRALLASS